MNAQRKPIAQTLLGLFSFMLCTGVALAGDTAAADAAADRSARLEALHDAVEQTGNVRVIVRLAGDDALAPLERALAARDRARRGQPASRSSVLAARRSAVARAQDAFMLRHNLGQNLAERFTYFPFVTIDADAAMLDELAASPAVADIAIDDFNETTLASTLPVIGANIAHQLGWDGAGYDIAIIDTGVDTDHPMLAGRVAADAAACFSDPYYANDHSLCPTGLPKCTTANGAQISDSACGVGAAEPCGSKCAHGTHVAGIAAGDGAEIGVAPGANIIPINVFIGVDYSNPRDGIYDAVGAYDSDIIRGLEHVLKLSTTRDIAAVNMSLGGGMYTTTAQCDSAKGSIKLVVDDLRAVGIATVVAAGNNGSSTGMSAPGCISTVISVGSTNDNDQISSFSNETPAMTLHAPGASVRSAMPGTGLGWMSGTSMAAPHVAGAVALLRQKAEFAGATVGVDNIVAALQQTGAEMFSGDFKVPRINVAAALDMLDATPPTTVIVDDRLHSGRVSVRQGSVTTTNDARAFGGQASQGSTAASNIVRFTPALPSAGFYTVSAMWPALSGNGSAINVTIAHAGGTETVQVNQTVGSGLWQDLGTYFFESGQTAYVELSDLSGGRLVADAVRFEQDGTGLAIATQELPDALEGGTYSTFVVASGGVPPYTWSISGSLPAGLTFDAIAGEIAGTPTASGTFAFTVHVQDTTGTIASQGLALTAHPAVLVSGTVAAPSGGEIAGVQSVTGLADVFIAASSGGYCEPTDTNGNYSCLVPVGWSGSIVAAAPGYAFEPESRSYSGVSADQSGQDFAAEARIETVWVEDSVPAGAAAVAQQDGWNWVSSNPTPFSGALAHDAPVQAGIHIHHFESAPEPLLVDAGDTLFTYIYLDPANPPRQIMMQWRVGGSWNQRAYWGENLIASGVDGTSSRRYIGPLPPTGQWVRLEIPAEAVGLAGSAVDGWAFTLYDGGATWDRSGVSLAQSAQTWAISGAVMVDGHPLAGVSMEGSAGAQCTQTDSTGWYSCVVADGWSGSIAPTQAGYLFEPASLDYSGLSSDQSGQDFAAEARIETVWVEDSVPAGAAAVAQQDGWNWVSSNPTPFSGALAHDAPVQAGIHIHHFESAPEPLLVDAGDTLFTYIYLDPANPPRQIMMQWRVGGSWNQRAYWGENLIASGVDGTSSRRYIGPLPPTGQWVRLEIPAEAVGLAGSAVDGWAFTLYDGGATWDRSGVSLAQSAQTWAISGAVMVDGHPLAGVSMEGSAGAQCTQTDSTGWYSCVVADGWSGSIAPTQAGYLFEPASLDYSGLSSDQSGQDFAAEARIETVWVEDSVPAGAAAVAQQDGWNWVSSNPTPFSGALAHDAPVQAGIHIHHFESAPEPLLVDAGDTLFTYIYLDPANPPRQIMMQWRVGGSWNQRAYWGENLIASGVDGTSSRRYIGALPPTGQWVRLEIPAEAVGLAGSAVDGWAFTLYDGGATWDRSGVVSGP